MVLTLFFPLLFNLIYSMNVVSYNSNNKNVRLNVTKTKYLHFKTIWKWTGLFYCTELSLIHTLNWITIETDCRCYNQTTNRFPLNYKCLFNSFSLIHCLLDIKYNSHIEWLKNNFKENFPIQLLFQLHKNQNSNLDNSTQEN